MKENRNRNVEIANKENNRLARREEDDLGLDFFRPFKNFFNDGLTPMFKSEENILKTDIQDEGNTYKFSMEVPGVDKKDIHVNLKNGYLTVNASLNRENKDDKGKNVHSERFSGSYTRSFYVGEGIDRKGIQASTNNGVLNIIVPKGKEENNSSDSIEVK